MIANVIGCQHGKLCQLIAQLFALHMEIRTDDRFDPGTVRTAIKLHQTTHIGEVGDGQGWHG
ncbi:hypothetical protein D3C77_656840 [compost metagenome]